MESRREHMWKKDEQPDAGQPASRLEGTSPRIESASPTRGGTEQATIGPSITIRGEVTGDEDLLIQGRVDGSVDLKQHKVTVGQNGQVKAGIAARVVTIEGKVEGDLIAEEQVILRSSARVEGDIAAPRVTLEDGATFRGGVDMGSTSDRTRRSTSSSSHDTKKSVETQKSSSGAGEDASEKPSSAAAK